MGEKREFFPEMLRPYQYFMHILASNRAVVRSLKRF